MEITALRKPAGTSCVHLAPQVHRPGCTIYGERPEECRAFRCSWLSHRGSSRILASERDRPDRLGLLLWGRETKLGKAIMARELWLGATASGRAAHVLHVLGVAFPVFLLRYDGTRALICHDPAKVEAAKRLFTAAGVRFS